MKYLCLLFLFVINHVYACINTSYSRDDEIQITDELVYIILGEFAHHGDAFYEQELRRTLPLLEVAQPKFEDLNDYGAALLKLARYEEAEKAFLKNDELYPNRYKTHSNLAVLYKKMGRYKDAELSLIKALEIQPEGHMGLGDYYLRMIQFLGKENKEDGLNFLGHSYDMKPEDLIKQENVNKEHLITLIKNDMSFADAYLVLGDVLMAEGDEQLALRAYYRVKDLSQALNSDVASYRLKNLRGSWYERDEKGYVVDRQGKQFIAISKEIKSAEKWLESFRQFERVLIEKGESASFDQINEVLISKGIHRQKIIEQGYFKGSRDWTADDIFAFVFIGVLLVILALILRKWLKAFKNRKALLEECSSEIQSEKRDLT